MTSPLASPFRPPPEFRARVEQTFTAWPEPPPPARWLLVVAAAVGLLAAVMLPDAPQPGVNLAVCGWAAATPVALAARQHGRRRGRTRPVGRVAFALGLLAVGLPVVAAIRSTEWLAWGCGLAAVAISAVVVLDARCWNAVLGSVPAFAVAVLRALPWAGRVARVENARSRIRPWLTGLASGLVCTVVVGGLLASADSVFAAAVRAVSSVVAIDQLPVRLLVFGLVAGTVLGGVFAVSTRLAWPLPAVAKAGRHSAEWLLPVVLVAVTIAAFLAIEASQLFGGAQVVHETAVSHADRAREGFGQLTVVTVLVLGLLSWAGGQSARGPAPRRRLMTVAGGVLLALTSLLAVSALRRLWLYQQAYGWTVTRLNGGAFELWVVGLLFGVGLGWLLRRTDLLPRFVIGSAGLGLLLVALAGPDALVARGDVHRFEHSHMIDTGYLSQLSADAVPALNRLPKPERSCALSRQNPSHDPWFGWNLSRARADRLLREHPVLPCPLLSRN